MPEIGDFHLGLYSQAKGSREDGWKVRVKGSRSVGQIALLIRDSEKLKTRIGEYRRLMGLHGKDDKPIVKAYKASRIPAFTPAGYIPGGLAEGWPEVHSALYQYDVEAAGLELAGKTLEQVLDSLRRQPYTALAFVSMSWGVKALLRGKPPDRKDYAGQKREWAAVMRRAAEDTGVPFDKRYMDPSVQNIERLCFFGSDPDVWLNARAEECQGIYKAEPEPEPVRKRLPKSWRGSSAGNGVDAMRSAMDHADPPDDRNEWYRLVLSLHRGGIPESEIESWCSRGPKYEAGEVAAVIRDPAERVSGKAPISGGTFIDWARRQGWQDPRMGRRRTPPQKLVRPHKEPEREQKRETGAQPRVEMGQCLLCLRGTARAVLDLNGGYCASCAAEGLPEKSSAVAPESLDPEPCRGCGVPVYPGDDGVPECMECAVVRIAAAPGVCVDCGAAAGEMSRCIPCRVKKSREKWGVPAAVQDGRADAVVGQVLTLLADEMDREKRRALDHWGSGVKYQNGHQEK